MSTPRNIATLHSALQLINAMDAMQRTGDPTKAVTEMEAQGQHQLVTSEVLPTDLNGDKKEDFIALGFKFGDVVSGDPLFQKVELPNGWKKEGSGHDMWSSVIDDKGRERVVIFYKAAFYDRSAHMNIRVVTSTEPL